jgi:hypothetical protein
MNLDEIERRANAATPGPWHGAMPACAHEHDDEVCSIEAPDSAVLASCVKREEDLQFILAARTDVPALIARVREMEAECERMKTFAAQNFSQMIRQEAEQMRAYGLSYEGVRQVLHEYNDGEISFGKLMDLIRAAARAMAEDMSK